MGQYARIALVLLAVAAVAFIALFLLARPGGGVDVRIEGENVSSTSGPRFFPGEEYVYEMRFGGGGVINSTVRVETVEEVRGTNCLRAVRNISGSPSLAACYFIANGSPAYFSVLGKEQAELPPETYAAEPVMIFYEPWMLALNDGWSGSLNLTSRLSPGAVEVVRLERRNANSYRFLRRENFSGRAALVAEAISRELEISDGKERITGEIRRMAWVDEEKRVVLKEIYEAGGERMEKVLVSAPFRLSPP